MDTMNIKEAAGEIQRRVPCTDYLKKSQKGAYICPFCGSGTGKNKSGALKYYKTSNKCSCWGGCIPDGANKAKSYDVIDIYMKNMGVDFVTAVTALAGQIGINISSKEEHQGQQTESRKKSKQTEEKPMENKNAAADPVGKNPAAVDQTTAADGSPANDPGQEQPEDLTAFFLQAAANIKKTDYHRGISLETLDRYKVGYVENWKHPKRYDKPAGHLIVPITKYTYLARLTRDITDKEQEEGRPIKAKVKAEGLEGGFWIFNRHALETATQPIVVVEGEIDALSVIDVGGEAVGLGSITNVGQFLEYVKDHKPTQPLVISLDNEPDNPRVVEANKRLLEGLQALGIPFYWHNVAGDHKDANDYLQADREAFTKEIKAIKHIQANEYRNQNSAAGYINTFLGEIAASVDTPAISTGFPLLDRYLDGGLYEGLYIVGAETGTGKTALFMQIMDNIAAAGYDVIVIALEMGQSELMARSISRHTIMDCIQTGEDTRNAKTARGITDYNRYGRYSTAEKNLISRSVAAYGQYAKNIFFREGIGDINAYQVREIVNNHIAMTGKTPVVLVDYLQLLAPVDVRATDKQNMDRNVLELKRISRDCKLPMVVISSLNRAAYQRPQPVGKADFKESGAIEYTVNVLLGFQFHGVGDDDFSMKKANSETPRKMEITCLKNRSGANGWTVQFDFYSMFSYFVENGVIGFEDTIGDGKSGKWKKR